MSSVGQAVGGIVGGVIGFYAGGPSGALYGFQIGAGIGGAVDPPVVQGQKIGDLAKQTAQEGGARAIVYGTARPIGGNVIATTPPIIRKKKQSGGKGSGPEVKTEEAYRTYAIGVCEGPITGYRRIWRDGKLVYFSGSEDFAENNAKFLQKATLYNGEFDAMPDSVLQGALGIDSVTPFRGTAYMVIDNENLTNVAGRIPQWTFEVVRAEGFVVTSRPYPIEFSDSMAEGGPTMEPPTVAFVSDSVDQSGPSIVSGDMKVVLITYDDALPEAIDQSGPIITGGVMYEDSGTTITYDDGEPEAIDQAGPTIVSGSLDTILIEYENWPSESIDQSGPEITGGSLT